MKIRCLLVDDEPPALKVIQNHIAQVNGLEIVASCHNALDALDVIQHRTVDVVFLDIKMPRILGTDLVRSLSHPPKIVFTTAYREYAVDGFELDVVDYLLKPVSFERFLKAVTKLKRIMGMESTMQQEEYKSNPNAFVYLRVDKEMQKILVNDILYIESWRDYVRVFLASGNKLLIKQSITSIGQLLSEHRFVRVHRSYIVSVERILAYGTGFLNVAGRQIPIGRLYKQQVMDRLYEG